MPARWHTLQDVQKSLGGPSRKSRRRGARLKPGSSAELASLFSQQQVHLETGHVMLCVVVMPSLLDVKGGTEPVSSRESL